jgi:hypothetical protein
MGNPMRIMAIARTMENQTMSTPISASRGRAPGRKLWPGWLSGAPSRYR